ncbi:MAG TPA: hypothetical protein VMM56_01865 [Planctomycetaceae bacterium]|nr:hypothetical protein [Planctomycetaceae bacterium]
MKSGIGLFVALVIGAVLSSRLEASSSSSLMQISSDGKLLVCTNRDNGTASVVDLATRQKLREITLGLHPEGVTFLGDSTKCATCVYGDDAIIFFDAATGEIEGRVDVFDEPYGIVSSPDGSKVYACLDYPGQLVEIDAAARKILATHQLGKFPRGLAISADGNLIYATEYYTGNVISFDLRTKKLADEWTGVKTDNLARQIVLHPTLDRAYVPHIRSKVDVAHGEGSIFPYVAVIKTKSEPDDSKRKRIPMDSFRGVTVTANPWECEVSPDGKTLYVVFGGTDDLFVCDILDDNYREIVYRGYLQTGKNPRAVKASPDGAHFYVYDSLDFQITEYDSSSLRVTERITVCDVPYSEEQQLGKALFYTALQPMTGRRWISCSSCHPDSDSDGRTWQNPEGLRNTPSLVGVAWTHPLHWSADRDETQDFEHTIRGPLMGGRGLVRGRIHDSLGEPNARLSDALDALALYSNTHKVPLSPYTKNGLSDAAKAGREIFLSEKTRCAECHKSPYFTDSNPAFSPKLHNVGTGEDDPTEIMGPAYDTPTLLGVYRTAPYLHDGRAQTLKEVLTTYNAKDKHGVTSHLSETEIDSLVEFLKALPFEDPEPIAIELQLKKVVK